MNDASAVTPVSSRAPLRIGYIIDSLTTGGAERLAVTFAEAVRAREDVDFTVFVLDDKDTPFLDQLRRMGTRVLLVPGQGIGDIGRFTRLVRVIQKQRLDYLHAHLTTATVLGSAASLALGIPFAVTVHNVRPSTRRVTKARQIIYRLAIKRPRILRIAVGQAVADALRDDIGNRDCRVIPNAFASSSIAPAPARAEKRAKLGIREGENGNFVLVAVGSLIPQKGYLDLLSVFGTVAARHPEAVLLIAGGSSQKEHAELLQQATDQMALGDQLRFLGLQSDIPALMSAGDIFVSASHWEGAPVALLEALANGLPCCVTDVGENARILAGTEALVVPPSQPEQLADAILELIADPEKRIRIAQAGRERAISQYGADVWADRLINLYSEHIQQIK